jgi:hypothetical protein
MSLEYWESKAKDHELWNGTRSRGNWHWIEIAGGNVNRKMKSCFEELEGGSFEELLKRFISSPVLMRSWARRWVQRGI